MKPTRDFFLLGDWTSSKFALSQVPASSWTVWTGKYPEIYKEAPIYKRKQHGYFLHITDMHVSISGVSYGIAYLYKKGQRGRISLILTEYPIDTD
jgi:hypothetical protein